MYTEKVSQFLLQNIMANIATERVQCQTIQVTLKNGMYGNFLRVFGINGFDRPLRKY